MALKTTYATCLKCAHVITWFENEQLRYAVDCPTCGAPKAFGPGVFVEDFYGYTWDEAIRQRAGKRTPSNVAINLPP